MLLELFVPEATRAVALALDADSIPVRRTETADGWIESDWFDAATLRPTSARRLGPDVVKVRAFVNPDKPNFSVVTLETVYRPVADPSRDDRLLEQQVPATHPVSIRMAALVNRLTMEFGEPLPQPDSTLQADTTSGLVPRRPPVPAPEPKKKPS